jgi:CheY-like chemotaxis protein
VVSRILVVDNDGETVALLVDYLRPDGHEVLTAGSGDEAVAKARAGRPDLILMDLDLGPGGKDGWEAIQEIRDSPDTKGIRIVVVTGADTPAEKERPERAGCDRFVTKPIDWLRLPQMVRDWLEG